ncbi:adenylate isopentenyltransferase 5, chloroplastic-like [Rhodamnia argentea]|uniref:Adenylate isopentenyltransferase 5, chloroplastic-like n=1 Tax=Rhodamnia argentea TaxID=178133 RepID=A0ABM3GZ11_9MYRT|nr:adenylate isopentenyltransferase 5, chloroplastic-like [Rhodamnia argentea]
MTSVSTVACKQAQVQPLMNFRGGLNMESFHRRRDKVVFVVGATGTGKSRLAIDLAVRFRGEVVNSDKIQVYKGLDVVANKVTEEECRGVPHHLLGIAAPDSEFTALDFRRHALVAIESILKRGRLPIVSGGSNSFIDALVNGGPEVQSRYDCCFFWVDVSMPVLHSFVSRRVDKMVEAGLVDEVRSVYCPGADNSKGIRRAIGVSEMERYLSSENTVDDRTRTKLLEEAVERIKANTCALACRQLEKIEGLRSNWDGEMNRIDATEVFLKEGKEADEAWARLVAGPCTTVLYKFLYGQDPIAAVLSTDTSHDLTNVNPISVFIR